MFGKNEVKEEEVVNKEYKYKEFSERVDRKLEYLQRKEDELFAIDEKRKKEIKEMENTVFFDKLKELLNKKL